MAELSETQRKAVDFASDTVKQLLTLASGTIALTITFSKELLGGTIPKETATFLVCGWITYGGSIFCGMWTLMALTGSLEQWVTRVTDKSTGNSSTNTVEEVTPAIGKSPQAKHSVQAAQLIYGRNVRIPAICQILLFLVGTGLIITFGVISVRLPRPGSDLITQIHW